MKGDGGAGDERKGSWRVEKWYEGSVVNSLVKFVEVGVGLGDEGRGMSRLGWKLVVFHKLSTDVVTGPMNHTGAATSLF